MALFKIGKTFYNGQPRNNYLLQGRACRDAENCPLNGKDHCRVSVAAMQLEDGTTIFVSVHGWRERAIEVEVVEKGDSVFAIGTLSVREHNGTTYYDLDAEYIACSSHPKSARAVTRGVDVSAADFGDTDNDPVLPPFAEIEEEDAHLPF